MVAMIGGREELYDKERLKEHFNVLLIHKAIAKLKLINQMSIDERVDKCNVIKIMVLLQTSKSIVKHKIQTLKSPLQTLGALLH